MRGIIVVIQWRVLQTDFVVLSMGEFNSIFGMDWMIRHKVLIYCHEKKVQLHLMCGMRVTF